MSQNINQNISQNTTNTDPAPFSPHDPDTHLICYDVKIAYPDITPIRNATFSLKKGSITALVGPSGCGKTSLLRAIAGFEPIQNGHILLNGVTLSTPKAAVPPHKRSIGFVFQEPNLFAHLTVRQNILFGISHLPKSEQTKRLDDMLAFIELPEKKDAYPHTLSGGQQQRVALARTLAIRPELLLLDEPFANLDAKKRAYLCVRLKQYLLETQTTTLFISHHPEDALAMASYTLTIQHNIVRSPK